MGVTLAFVCEALERGWLSRARGRRAVRLGRLARHAAAGRDDRARARDSATAWPRARGGWRSRSIPRPRALRLRGQAPRAARPLGARAQGPVHRLRDGHARRQPPRHAPDAAVRADLRSAVGTDGKPAFAVRSQHFTARRRLARPLPLHLRARLRPVYVERAVRARWCGPSPAGTWTSRSSSGWASAIINLERLFNVREGVRRAQDVLPWKVMHEPIPDGPSAGACTARPRSSARCSTRTTPCAAGAPTACPRAARLAALGL